MPRISRLGQVIPNGCHHVWLRGNNRRRLFSYAYEYTLFLRLLGAALRRTQSQLHAFALLGNHIHLLLTVLSASSLAQCVHLMAQRYAQMRNRRRGASGKLFEERFGCKAVQDEAYAAVALAYIDLNPCRAGLVQVPEHYRWSSAWLHLQSSPTHYRQEAVRSLWTPHPWYESLGSTREQRAQAYQNWLTDCVEHDRISAFEHPSNRSTSPGLSVLDRRPNGTDVTR